MALQAIVAETHALDRLTLQAMAGLVGDDGVVVAGLPGSRTRITCAGTEATAARRRRSGVARLADLAQPGWYDDLSYP